MLSCGRLISVARIAWFCGPRGSREKCREEVTMKRACVEITISKER